MLVDVSASEANSQEAHESTGALGGEERFVRRALPARLGCTLKCTGTGVSETW